MEPATARHAAPEPSPCQVPAGSPSGAVVRAVLDGLPDMAHVYDAEWRWLYLNRSARGWIRGTGRHPDALIGRCVWDEFPGARDLPAYAAAREAMRAGRDYSFELTQSSPDGPRHFETRVVAIPGGILTLTRERTTERRATEELRRWADLVAHTAHGLSVSDVRTDAFVLVNPAFARMLGYEPEALVGMPVADVYAPEVRHEAPERIRAANERGTVTFDTVCLRRDGGRLPVRVQLAAVPGPDGRPRHRVANMQDIRELTRLETRQRFLAEAGARLSTSLDVEETVRELVRLAVPRLADWAIFNVQDEGSPLLRIVEIQHRDPERVAYARALASRYPMRADEPAGAARALRTGEPQLLPHIPDEVLATVAQDAEHLRLLRGIGYRSLMNVPLVARGRVLGVLSFARTDEGCAYDADDLAFAQELAQRAALAIDNAQLFAAERRTREEAERARAAAEAANHAKADFLATMSHELRTPINAALGYGELLTLGLHGPLTDAQREALERIRRSQHRLLALVNDVLSFARLDAGQLRLVPADVPLTAVLADVEALMRPQLDARGLRYASADAAAVAVRADRDRLEQILLNLLSNACKFTPAGGAVRVSCAAADGMVRVTVADTGRGIAPELHASVFEPFVQVDGGLTRTTEGTGLGLAISRSLARAMGGDLTLESAPGRGAAFTLSLPAA